MKEATRVIGLNVLYLLMLNNDDAKHESTQECVLNSNLVQVKGSRVLLLCNVHVCKPCMQCVKHAYE